MSNLKRNPGEVLDSAVAAMRNTVAADSQVEEAACRVLDALQSECAKVITHPAMERIRSCEDFRALIPAYLSAALTPSRKLLFEDHIHECVTCRKALENTSLTGDFAISHATASRKNRRLLVRVGFSAAVAAIVLLFVVGALRDIIWPIEVHAVVQTVEGGLYRVERQQVRPLVAGERIGASEVVRTGNSAGAVLELPDGSRIEMSARSELWLDRARDGVRINLNRGKMIVTAAKQNEGHLYAATKEVGVSVVGTVFQMNAGVKGSRVSVVEGEVRVRQGRAEQPLRPGQQFSTDPAMGAISVEDEIAWSRDFNRYVELLNVARDLADRVATVETRHTSDLVPLVPENTVVFVSLPNITQSIADSYALFKQRLNENKVLAEWWERRADSRIGEHGTDQFVERLARVGRYLGAEVVFAFPKDVNTEAPVVLADVTSSEQLAAALVDAGFRVVFSPGELQSSSGSTAPVIFIGQGLMIASADARQILKTLAYRAQPASNGFAATPLYARLAQAYTDGVGFLLAADLERLLGTGANPGLQQAGIGDVQQVVIEQKRGSDGLSYRAALSFKQNRRGVAAWLAEPSPMGALEFISPDAYGVAAIVTKDPSVMFDEALAMVTGRNGGSVLQDLLNYEAEHHVDIRHDVVSPLGNEFLLAVDGPILPTPAWRAVIEINDAARLQNTIEWAIAEFNRDAAARERPGIKLVSETAGGRTFYSVVGSRFPTELHYTFWAGYMLVAPSRAMLMQAIQNHDTGNSLLRATVFRSQLPADGRDYASGFVFQNVQALTNSVPTVNLNTPPSLICFYGEPEQIVLSSKGVLGLDVASTLGIAGLLNGTGVHGIK
jgi:hypothetical protein